jgi:translation initiation factor 5A
MMEAKKISKGTYIEYDSKPYYVSKAQSMVVSRHSHTRVKLDMIGVLDGDKRSITVAPHDKLKDIELIRRHGQFIAHSGKNLVQVMSMDTYETFDAEIQDEIMSQLTEGDEVTYVEFGEVPKVIEIRR